MPVSPQGSYSHASRMSNPSNDARRRSQTIERYSNDRSTSANATTYLDIRPRQDSNRSALSIASSFPGDDQFFDAEENFVSSPDSTTFPNDGWEQSNFTYAPRSRRSSSAVAVSEPHRNAVPGPSYASIAHADLSVIYPHKCEQCQTYRRDIWFCNACEAAFCPTCWDKQFIHKRDRENVPVRTPHEKTNMEIAKKVQNALSPPADDRTRERMYQEDEITSWFGIERPSDSDYPIFQDYGRLTDLMSSTNRQAYRFIVDGTPLRRDRRTPSLVSFVGQTGAGKSTLIKLLIEFAMEGTGNYATPVVGTRDAHLPTSEDVHLYLDPRTADGDAPLLLADCEGLEGGEREPQGFQFRKQRRNAKNQEVDETGRISRAIKVISERRLIWASESGTRSRQFAVTNLYPRLLYTFSDVIVFVLKNPRVVERVFEQLIKWAAAAIETSSNQPVLPHAIIALNASDHNHTHSTLWDTNNNTNSILDDLASTVNRNETFKHWAQFWRARGKPIETLEQLVLCYYSSVQIIRIPADGRPKLMHEQIEKLYQSTITACVASRAARHQLRMLLDVEDFQNYLQNAFNHFASSLEFPFDFVQASFRNSPIPPDFGGNILKLALSIMDIWKDLIDASLIKASAIFSEISYMVASCIMFDAARNKNKGSAAQIFPKYLSHIDDALDNFCNNHWPCEFVKDGVRCVNVRVGHSSKGHQSRDGKVFAAGPHESSFTFENSQNSFRNWVYWNLWELLYRLPALITEGASELRAAAVLHREKVLSSFFRRTTHHSERNRKRDIWTSHTACFCCLFEQAEHALPCGHVLCQSCVEIYSYSKSHTEIEIRSCPIENKEFRLRSPWLVYLRPKYAGVRVMTLDGGGMRGIVELETLRAIESTFDDSFRIQDFFDLIVGTSTGGLIALGLTSMNWTVAECIQQFESLCKDAFTRRKGGGLPLIGHFVDNYHHSKYKTSSLEGALKTAFTENQKLFGGNQKTIAPCPAKVAVTATSSAGKTTYVLANYNRANSGQQLGQYQFQRPERAEHELKIWEAARATSAAPRFFRPFHHESSQRTYVDGAIYHNNPIRVAEAERKLIWPEVDYPDVVVSLGTSFSTQLHRMESDRMQNDERRGIVSHGMSLVNIVKNHMATSLNCERAWDEFLDHLPRNIAHSRFIRINPELSGKVPELDDVQSMIPLQQNVGIVLARDPRLRGRVHNTAMRLFATLFYFHPTSPIAVTSDGRFETEGYLHCRFPEGSQAMVDVGRFLKKNIIEQGSAQFLFAERDCVPKVALQLTPEIVHRVIGGGPFNMHRIVLNVSNKDREVEVLLHFGPHSYAPYPISGFPRTLSSFEEQVSVGRSFAVSKSNRYSSGSRRAKLMEANWKPPDPNLSVPLEGGKIEAYASSEQGLGNILQEKQSVAMPTTQEHQSDTDSHTRNSATRGNAMRNAFRALLWPVRASPQHEADSRADQRPMEELGGDKSQIPYEVGAPENDVYHDLIRRLQMPPDRIPDMPELDGNPINQNMISELPASFEYASELPTPHGTTTRRENPESSSE